MCSVSQSCNHCNSMPNGFTMHHIRLEHGRHQVSLAYHAALAGSTQLCSLQNLWQCVRKSVPIMQVSVFMQESLQLTCAEGLANLPSLESVEVMLACIAYG